MLHFGLRNLLLFFKDKTTLFLSFLAEFIIVGLYLLFIRDNLISGFSQIKDVELLMDVWMISGVLGITSVTTTMGAYGIMVDDRAKKISRDFATSPIRKFSLLGGYMFSAVIIGLVLSFLLLVLSEIYIYFSYGVKLGAEKMLLVYGVLVLTTVSNSSLVLFLISFLKSSNALAACCTILGALIGFLTGIYLPMGNLSGEVQRLVRCFPVSHGVVMLRQILLEPLVSRSFGGLQTPPALQFQEYMGIRYPWDGGFLPLKTSAAVLLGGWIIFTLASVWNLSVREKRSRFRLGK